MSEIVAHQVTSWLLICGHAITCHCLHEVGQLAWCLWCEDLVRVEQREVHLYMRREVQATEPFLI